MPLRAVASATVFFLLAPSVQAQDYGQMRRWCLESAPSNELAVQGCTAVIAENLESKDEIAAAYLYRGIASRRLGNPGQAIKDYGEAIRLRPTFSQAFNSRCYLHAITDRLQEALKDCNEALRLDPNNQYAYDSRAFTYLKLGMLDASIADYDAALGLQPGRPYSLFGRGVARQRKGDKSGGQADMTAARDQVPGIAEEFARYGVKAN